MRRKIQNYPPALIRPGIDPEHWLYITKNFESEFKGVVCSAYELKAKIKHFCSDKIRIKMSGMKSCQRLLS